MTQQDQASFQSYNHSLKTKEKDTIKRLFDKYVIKNKMFETLEDTQERIETACVLIMDNLKLTRSALQIPEPDRNGP